jgi:tetraacyldisaccharide 4'-kinase
VDVTQAGDEPMLLARLVPEAVVVVGATRHLAGVVAERALGATVHVLDDGFQHLPLVRDADVLVTTPGEIEHGRVLPFGRLRETADAASGADLLIVVGASPEEADEEARRLGIARACGARRLLGRPRWLGTPARETEAGDNVPEPCGSVVAMAGIAHPERFFEGLRSLGWEVRRALAFPDHHWYSSRDLARVADAIRSTGAEAVLTTDKDAVRLEAMAAEAPPTLRTAREQAERELVVEALRRHRGRIAAAATELGVSRPTLYELMAKLGIDRA